MSFTSRNRAAAARKLRQFVRRLKDARRASPRDPETVHQLRVAARRAEAVLELFEAWLPPRRTARLTKRIRRIRRRAGRARDLDLLAGSTASSASPDRPPIWLLEARAQAYRRVRRSARKASRRRLKSSVQSLLRRMRWRAAGPEADGNGLLTLRLVRAAELLEGGESWLDNPRALHRLRIRCRELRYACESLPDDASVRSTPLGPLLETLAELQDRLGALHDRDVQRRQLLLRREYGVPRKADARWIAERLERIEQASPAAHRRQATRLLRQARAEAARLLSRLTRAE